jgi:methyltransferase (TIGR00027 family)
MHPGQPSLTAHRAAAHRALHQTLEDGRLFADPFAAVILGEPPEAFLLSDPQSPPMRAMRLFLAARSRFAEDALAAAVARGTRQYVVLGAGLDTFSLRSPHPGLRVFEVDHPATQAWKRERLAAAGLAVPPDLTFAPVDFEHETLAAGLSRAGFDAASPVFFSWLGVVPYLTREAVDATLAFIASVPSGEVVFDYADPPSALAPEQRALHDRRAARVAALGEPWQTYFQPEELARDLRALGLGEVEDLGPGDIAARYFGMPRREGPGGHILRARRVG